MKTHTEGSQRALRQRRERFVRKRSESAARDIWTALIVKTARPDWQKYTTILKGIQTPKCSCIQCVGDSLTEAVELEILSRAKKAI